MWKPSTSIAPFASKRRHAAKQVAKAVASTFGSAVGIAMKKGTNSHSEHAE